MKMRSRLTSALAIAGILAMLGVVSAQTAEADTEQTAARSFTTIDGTLYGGGPSIGNGAKRAYLVPYASCIQLQNDGDLENEQAWKDMVLKYDTDPGGPGFLVLDCEQLYFAGHSASVAAEYEATMQKIQSWARQVEPTKTIGWYGLVNNTSSANAVYYKELLAAEPDSVFFPSDYTFSPDVAGWYSTLLNNIAAARALDPSVKVYPFIWPQYHDHAAAEYAKKFLPSDQWNDELHSIAATDADGMVVWGGNTVSNTCDASCESTARTLPWLKDTRNFMRALRRTPPDIALHKTTTASSVIRNLSDRAPSLAVDGDPDTRWASDYADDQWLQVDLGRAYDIDQVRVNWHTAYGLDYKIQVSDDGETWVDVDSVTNGRGGSDWLGTGSAGWNAAAAHGRYIRMLGITRGTQYSFALTGFQVYGTPVFGPMTVRITGATYPGSLLKAHIGLPGHGRHHGEYVYSYQWIVDGTAVSSATGDAFRIPRTTSPGSTIQVSVTRTREGYTAEPVTSNPVHVRKSRVSTHHHHSWRGHDHGHLRWS